MKVWHLFYEYALYMDSDDAWIMHTYIHRDGRVEWRDSHINVSERSPFSSPRSSSRVEYDAWR